jgi:hypothetical protein
MFAASDPDCGGFPPTLLCLVFLRTDRENMLRCIKDEMRRNNYLPTITNGQLHEGDLRC